MGVKAAAADRGDALFAHRAAADTHSRWSYVAVPVADGILASRQGPASQVPDRELGISYQQR